MCVNIMGNIKETHFKKEGFDDWQSFENTSLFTVFNGSSNRQSTKLSVPIAYIVYELRKLQRTCGASSR